MIEKWRKPLDEGVAIAALPTDVSEAFDCFPHELLIAKLHDLVVDTPFLELLHLYLGCRIKFSLGLHTAPYKHYYYLTNFCVTYSSFLLI